MTWILILLFVTLLALGVLIIELKRDTIKQHHILLNKMNELNVSIKDAHAQVINAEKISRYALEASSSIVEKFSKLDDNNSDIHNVCIMIAKEIQAAREAQKRP